MLKLASFYASILCFVLGLISWARQPDVFVRDEITFDNAGQELPPAVLIRPRLKMPWPVLLYAHGNQSDPLKDGGVLPEMAGVGFICVDARFDQSDFKTFTQQFESLISRLDKRKVPGERAWAWVADGINADFFIRFAAEHPKTPPDMLVCMPEAGKKGAYLKSEAETARNLGFPILVLGRGIQINSSHEKNLVRWLLRGKNQVDLFTYTNSEIESPALINQEMAEKAGRILFSRGKARVLGPVPRQPIHSAWIFFWPATALFMIYAAVLVWTKTRDPIGMRQAQKFVPCAAFVLGISFGVALVVWSSAKGETRPKAIPDFARKWGRTDAERNKISEYLALADYNRRLVNWNVGETEYKEYVLHPVLNSGIQSELQMRWTLWRFFYPKIRKTGSPLESASILVQNLREEVQIQDQSREGFDFARIWNNRAASPAGFEILYVAALRSVGVAARINSRNAAEIFDNGKWSRAPRPLRLVPP